MTGPTDFTGIFRSIDARDADGFAAHLDEDAVFTYGSQPPVRGRDAIREYVAGFFSALAGVEHRVVAVHQAGADVTIVEGQVTYHRDGLAPVTLPFANVLRRRGGDRFSDYRIYIDPTPLAG